MPPKERRNAEVATNTRWGGGKKKRFNGKTAAVPEKKLESGVHQQKRLEKRIWSAKEKVGNRRKGGEKLPLERGTNLTKTRGQVAKKDRSMVGSPGHRRIRQGDGWGILPVKKTGRGRGGGGKRKFRMCKRKPGWWEKKSACGDCVKKPSDSSMLKGEKIGGMSQDRRKWGVVSEKRPRIVLAVNSVLSEEKGGERSKKRNKEGNAILSKTT